MSHTMSRASSDAKMRESVSHECSTVSPVNQCWLMCSRHAKRDKLRGREIALRDIAERKEKKHTLEEMIQASVSTARDKANLVTCQVIT